MRLMAQPRLPEVVERYLKAVQADNPVGALTNYPGSPLLSAQAMRAQDRMAVCELQEAETATLKALFAHDSRVDVRAGDGYALLRSLLPPKFNGSKIGRGLVLIDPPYEAQDAEYQAVLAALAETLARWPQATCAVWFPIKHHPALPAQGHRPAGEIGDDDRVPGAPGRLAAAPQRQRHAAAQPAVAVRPGGRPGPAGAAPAPGRTGASTRLDWLKAPE
jgi:23S rRNA (adenine2030-N6)-methyltransferase